MMLDQFLERRRPYQAVWTLALLVFGAAAACEFIANLTGWSSLLFRLWFLFGASLSAAVLGLGSAYLFLQKRWANLAAVGLALAGGWAAYRMLTLPLPPALALSTRPDVPPSLSAVPPDLTAMVAVLNSLGTLAIVAGAIWSAWLYRRSGGGYRVASNLLIALGALILASSGSLAGVGRPEYLFAGELAGISVIFAGFLRSQPEISPASLPLLRHLRPGSHTHPQRA